MNKVSKLLVATALAISLSLTATVANAYTKPSGIQVFSVPNYGVTIAIWADQHPVSAGGALVLFELQNGNWVTCGICAVPPLTSLANDISAAGSAENWVMSKLPDINALLATRYPPIGAPTSPTDQVNTALLGFAFKIVNGSPVLFKP
ncbi:MAG: hypothetical protein E6R03_04410 [Hyphomicrobiaceae bacterium]|nr:MAG: hypothetical protein E6R03_04410 [Hyphomicrobiaceae bacterium]